MEERSTGPEDGVACAPAQLPALGQAGSWKSLFVERLQGFVPQGRCWHRGLGLGDSTLEVGFGDFPKMPSLAVAMEDPPSTPWAGVVYSKRQRRTWDPSKSQKIRKEAAGILPGRSAIHSE